MYNTGGKEFFFYLISQGNMWTKLLKTLVKISITLTSLQRGSFIHLFFFTMILLQAYANNVFEEPNVVWFTIIIIYGNGSINTPT